MPTLNSRTWSPGVTILHNNNYYTDGTLAGSLTGSILIIVLALLCLSIALCYFAYYNQKKRKLLRITTQVGAIITSTAVAVHSTNVMNTYY